MGEVTLATVIDAVPGGPRRVVGDTTTLVTSVTHESRSVEPSIAEPPPCWSSTRCHSRYRR